MTDERTRDTVMIELGSVSRAKRDAVERSAFAEAADWRGKEIALQRELHALGGPRPGEYRIRVDRPDGSWTVHEGPDYMGLLDGMGVLDVTGELRLMLDGVDMLARAIDTGVTIAGSRRRRAGELSVTLSDLPLKSEEKA